MSRRFRRKPKFYRPPVLLQQLEDRIVLDAAVNPAVKDNTTDNAGNPSASASDAIATPQTEAAGGNAGLAAAKPPDSLNQVFQHDLNVVLVSNALSDVKAISDAAAQDAKVIVYDAAHDNLATIEQKLSDLVTTSGQKIDHIAILSHGDPGALKLTSTSLFTAASVQSNPGPWSTLGTLLSPDARIDLYGCSIGQGAEGIALVQTIGQATHATVWASDDMTGNITGADWDLEVKTAANSLSSLIDPASIHTEGFFLSASPVADSQTVTVNEDGITLTITVTGSDATDPDVTLVSFEVTNPVTHGTLTPVAGSLHKTSTGQYSEQFLYTPNPDYNGADSFQFVMKTLSDPEWQGFNSGNVISTDFTFFNSLALGDVNGDGKLDMIEGNVLDVNKVYLGNGDGTFSYKGSFGYDSDGTQCLVLRYHNGIPYIYEGNDAGICHIYLGDEDGDFVHIGNFGETTDLTVSIALGDVNGDGTLDIVQGNQLQVSKVYRGLGPGSFTYASTFGSASDITTSIALGDMNGDGILDIVQGNYGPTSKVYLGNGDGTFAENADFALLPFDTASIALGDFNGDGKLDIVQGNKHHVSCVYLGDWEGDYMLTGFGLDSDATISIALGDVNGDGTLDIVQGNIDQPSKIYLGEAGMWGSVSFEEGGTLPSERTWSVALGDANGDGMLDVFQGNSASCRVYLNMGIEYTTVTTSAAATVGITVTSVNDAPSGADHTATMLEDGTYVLTAADFGFTDPHDNPANAFAAVKITQLETAGSLKLSGLDVTLNQVIAKADIDAGNLVFRPDANGNGTAYANFTFAVMDNGGTDNGGVNTDQSPNTFTFNVTAVNDAPVLTLNHGAGALDPTFSSDGRVTTDLGGSDVGQALAVQDDGKIVVAGYSDNDFAVARYNADGSPDSTFGTNGVVKTDFWGLGDAANAVAIQADGKIVVAGYAYTGTNTYDFAIARYDTNGVLDSTFDGDGRLTTPFTPSPQSQAWAVSIQPDDKIVVGGWAYTASGFDFALARYNTNGSPDGSFGTGGKVTNDFVGWGADVMYDLAIQPDGKIVAAGYFQYNIFGLPIDFGLARYNANGTVDTSFDGDGWIATNFGGDDYGQAVAIQSDGKIVVSGYTWNGSTYAFDVARYNSNGGLDTSFDGDGKLTTDFGSHALSYDVGIQPDGKIVAAGYALQGSQWDFALARYNSSNGSPDTSFDGDGRVTTDFGSVSDVGYAMAIQPDGKIVVGGYTSNGSNNDFALARYDVSTLAYTENDAPTTIDGGITITDVDSAFVESARITLTGYSASGEDVLGFANTATITGTWHADTGILDLTGADTIANYQAALRSVTYENTSDAPHTDVRTVTWSVNDGVVDSAPQAGTITVTAVNDPPTSLGVPDPPAQSEDFGSFTYNVSGYFSDPDGPTLTYELAEQTYHGGLVLDGLYIDPATGVVTFTSHQDSYGSVDVSVRAHDGTLYSDWQTFTLTVNSVNDAPVATAGIVVSGEEDLPILITVGMTDPHDAAGPGGPNNPLAVDITAGPAHGHLAGDGLNWVYTPDLDWFGTDSFSYTVKDDGGTANGGVDTSAPETVTINVSAVNDAPVESGIELTNLAYGEKQGPVAITSTLTLTDPDSANVTGATITISSNYRGGEDLLGFTNTPQITGSWDSATGTLTLTGMDTVANYQAALHSVTYQDTSFNPDTSVRTVSFTVTDEAAPPPNLDSNTITRDISVTAIDNAPINTVPIAVQQNDVNGVVTFDSAHDNLIAISDVDAGSGPLKVTLTATHGTMTLHGVAGLNFNAAQGGVGDGTADATMTFFGTESDINTALNGMTFTKAAGYIGLANLTMTVNDQGNTGVGGPLSATSVANLSLEPFNVWFAGFGTEAGWQVWNDAQGAVYTHNYSTLWYHSTTYDTWWYSPNGSTWSQVSGLGATTNADTNDAPVISGLPIVLSVTEDTPQHITGISVSDADVEEGAGSHQLTMDLTVGHGTLALVSSTGLTVTGAGTGHLTATGTQADINAALASDVVYTPSTNYYGSESFGFSVSDNGNYPSPAQVTNSSTAITVAALNDAPVLTVPAAQQAYVNTPLAITGLAVADVDVNETASPNNTLHMQLDVANGTLSLANINGLTFDAGHGNGTGSVWFTGNLNNIGSALATVTYTPTLGYTGTDVLEATVNDQVHTGLGGPLSDTGGASIDISAHQNQAPMNTVPTAVQQTDVNGVVTFDSAHDNLISISDVDAGSGPLKVTLTATHGTMTLHGVAGLNFSAAQGGVGDGTADATMTFFGTESDINTALNGMTFTKAAGYTGLANLTMTVNDQGNAGAGGPLSATSVANLSVEPYNRWFSGFGTEAGWQVWNDVQGSVYTHNYTVLWYHCTTYDTWWYSPNGSTWVPTTSLGATA